jgi:hypothetical protein
MSKTHLSFDPQTIAIAQIAVVILSRPEAMSTKMTLQDGCARAYNLLCAAARTIEERAAALDKVQG